MILEVNIVRTFPKLTVFLFCRLRNETSLIYAYNSLACDTNNHYCPYHILSVHWYINTNIKYRTPLTYLWKFVLLNWLGLYVGTDSIFLIFIQAFAIVNLWFIKFPILIASVDFYINQTLLYQQKYLTIKLACNVLDMS